MSADRLREAAALLRERAGEATPGQWEAVEGDYRDDWPIRGAGGGYLCTSPDDGVRGGHDEEDAHYIVMMHPPVALALADWLDAEAATATPRGLDPHVGPAALAVADEILGSDR